MTLQTLSPQAAKALLDEGKAVLVDIRPADEHAREHIAIARNIPMDQLPAAAPALQGRAVVFHCRSGQRTRLNAQALRAATSGEAYVLEGGLDGWKQAGLPVRRDTSQPLELQRQVMIAAGTLVTGGTALGTVVSPWFYLLPGFVGCGLVFAGLTGFCGMARLLMKMPWNRRALAATGL
ncbi:rhodanese family protein [Comamonas humi]